MAKRGRAYDVRFIFEKNLIDDIVTATGAKLRSNEIQALRNDINNAIGEFSARVRLRSSADVTRELKIAEKIGRQSRMLAEMISHQSFAVNSILSGWPPPLLSPPQQLTGADLHNWRPSQPDLKLPTWGELSAALESISVRARDTQRFLADRRLRKGLTADRSPFEWVCRCRRFLKSILTDQRL